MSLNAQQFVKQTYHPESNVLTDREIIELSALLSAYLVRSGELKRIDRKRVVK